MVSLTDAVLLVTSQYLLAFLEVPANALQKCKSADPACFLSSAYKSFFACMFLFV